MNASVHNKSGKLVISNGSVEFCEATPIGLVDEPKVSLYGRMTDRDLCVAPVDATRDFYLFSPNEHRWRGMYAARLLLLFSFPCSADHEQDWPPCKVVFFRVGNQYAECEKQQQHQHKQKVVCLLVVATLPFRNRPQAPLPLVSYMCVCVCIFFQFILDIKFVGRTSRGHTHRISHPPSYCGACLNFSREKDSAISFPCRP